MSGMLPPGPPPRPDARAGVHELHAFGERIDVRSPAEFAEDHLPGAVNLPVLDNAERARVGALYAQVSAFEARKVGAALAARNIARMVETHARDKTPTWRPLVYCWRGGQRSRAVVHVLGEIGWRAVQLSGGYRAYRRHVVAKLEAPLAPLDLRVVCGPTGSGKSRLLGALAATGAQVLDLEGLARHRGSLLGDLPDDPQPGQKAFESALCDALGSLDPQRPVFVESESKRIGVLQVPDRLLEAMRAAQCVRVDTPRALRVALLKSEYGHFLTDPQALGERLEHLVPVHGRKTIVAWRDAAAAGDFDPLVGELLDRHYDPLYARSIERNFPRHADARVATVTSLDAAAFDALAHDVVARERTPETAVVTP